LGVRIDMGATRGETVEQQEIRERLRPKSCSSGLLGSKHTDARVSHAHCMSRTLPVPVSPGFSLINAGKLKKRDKILERVGRLKERYPNIRSFVEINVTTSKQPRLECSWVRTKYEQAMARDAAY